MVDQHRTVHFIRNGNCEVSPSRASSVTHLSLFPLEGNRTSRIRFLASLGCFAGALAFAGSESAAAAALPAYDGQPCFEDDYGGQAGHDFFGGGACYQCTPNDCHDTTLPGYCHTYH